MNRRHLISTSTVAALVCISIMATTYSLGQAEEAGTTDTPNTGMADPVALINAFDRFRAAAEAGRFQVLPLTGLRGLASEALNAGGSVTIDMSNGSIVSQVRGLPANGAFDLWLIDNRTAARHTTL